MRSEPSTKTGIIFTVAGIIITAIGVILEWIPQSSTEHQLQLLTLSTILYGDIGPGLIAGSIGWIISSISPLKKFFLLPISVGIIMPTITLALGTILLDVGYLGAFIWHLTIFIIPPALITSGVLAGIIIERHRIKDKIPEIRVSFEKYLIYIVSASLFLIFLGEPMALLRLVPVAITTWILWHLISPRLASNLLIKKMREGRNRYELISHSRVREELTFSNVFSKSYYPLAFGIGFSLTLFNIIELFPFLEDLLPPKPMEKVVQIAVISILAIVVGSSYVGPVVWLYRDSGLRIKDNVISIVEEPKIHPFASSLIEVYNFIQAPISFTIAVTGGNYIYAFTLLAFLIVTILTVSLSATIMYIKFSSENNLSYLFNKLVNEKVLEPPRETT